MDRILLGWIVLFLVTAIAEGLQVIVPERSKKAMLFQPVVLSCRFSTSSQQPAVIQWKFKSYCQDRMKEALGMATAGAQPLSKRNLEWDPYLDCVDSRRTVRVVASKQGSVVTLGEFYRGRDISFGEGAELKIGKVMWGDSGLYYCIVTTPDDVEGKNEDSVELLVLVYEAGKAAKAGYPPSVSSVPGPYYIPSVPVGGVSSSAMLMDKPHPPPLASSDSIGGSQSVRKGYRIQADKERDSMKVLYYVEKELAQFDPARRMRERYNNTISELSSLHEENGNFCQSYRQMRRKPLPSLGNMESDTDYWTGVMGNSGGSGHGPSSSNYNKEDRDSFRHSQQRSKSEMLSRKNFAMGMPAVSMDELAAFADSYNQRSHRGEGNSQEPRGGSRFERSESRAHGGLYNDSSLEEYYSKRSRSREPLTDSDRGWSYSPPRRRANEDKHLPRLVSRTPGVGQKYDHTYLSSVLERKSRGEGSSGGGSLETPSKLSSQPLQRSGSYYAWSPPTTYKAGSGQQPSSQPDEEDELEDTLPPYSELELTRGPSYRGRESLYHSNSEKKRKKDLPKKTNDFPTRMSLVV
ncbi:immunoglobulin-like domain-containing receptor 2 isoform X5 [Notamacropus eugenii]|uniref:immunoglobulin-like domain-containing receptor 2 isoform X5 n=1 Tax=Notamacropus eugenii TaxID=9315 RepID=UPI003B67D6FE